MASRLYYLLTYLPSLPSTLGETFSAVEAIEKIREEGEANLLFLADLLETEKNIEAVAVNFFVNGDKNFSIELPESLPESFTKIFNSYFETSEAEWITFVFQAWFELIHTIGKKSGSQLLVDWAAWEWTLRAQLRIDRLKTSGKLPESEENLIPAFVKDALEGDFTHRDLIKNWKGISNPMDAEKFLDQARIDFLDEASELYSFDLDELVSYMLKLRIHARYARLSLDKGRKILEEVTAL